jgi:hypothetical protein
MPKKNEMTDAPVAPGNTAGQQAEFGRIADVTRLYGLRRGTIYNLLQSGKIRGCLLRVRGQKSGVRLIDLSSVRTLCNQQCQAEQGAT